MSTTVAARSGSHIAEQHQYQTQIVYNVTQDSKQLNVPWKII